MSGFLGLERRYTKFQTNRSQLVIIFFTMVKYDINILTIVAEALTSSECTWQIS